MEPELTFTVDFEPVGLRIEVEEHKSILDAARTILISETNTLNAPCGGKGLCKRWLHAPMGYEFHLYNDCYWQHRFG